MVCRAKDKNFLDGLLEHAFDEELVDGNNASRQIPTTGIAGSAGIAGMSGNIPGIVKSGAQKQTEESKSNKINVKPPKNSRNISVTPGLINKNIDILVGQKVEDIPLNKIPEKFSEADFRAIGKKSTLIEKENFGGSIDNILLLNKKNKIDLTKTYTYDPVRFYSRKVYNVDKNFKLNFGVYQRGQIMQNINNNPLLHSLTLISSSTDTNNPSDFGRIIETYGIDINKTILGYQAVRNGPLVRNHDMISKFINGGTYSGSGPIQDQKRPIEFPGLFKKNLRIPESAFEMQKPLLDSEELNSSVTIGAQILKIKQEYNSYIKNYEKLANSSSIDENGNTFLEVEESLLPNLYILSLVSEEENNSSSNLGNSINPYLKKYAYLDDYIPRSNNPYGNKQLNENTLEYFDSFSLNYRNFNSLSENKDEMLNRSKNLFIKTDLVKQISTLNEKKYLFPMSITVSIPTDKKTVLTRMMKETNLLDSFIDNFIKKRINNQTNLVEFYNSTEYTDNQLDSTGDKKKTEKKYAFERASLNSYDVATLISELSVTTEDTDSYVTLSSSERKNNSRFVNSLNSLIFNSKLQSLVQEQFRNFADLYKGKKSYNETVFYRLQKRDYKTGKILQNYWFPNDPDVDTLDIIDTQVKYNKKYTYSIFAYQFVVGTEYWYDDISIDTQRAVPGDFDKLLLRIVQEPKLSIIEVPIASQVSFVNDDFPLAPDVNFIPFTGIDNTIGISFNNSSGMYMDFPIVLRQEDENVLKNMDIDQKNKIVYESDDIPKSFEIFRLEHKPKSYEDFKNSKITSISTTIDGLKNLNAPAAMFKDNIEPNKKYYYIFRTIDIHNKFSNPTGIFEVEMINQNGMIFPIIKEVQFDTYLNKNSIEARRFIYINTKNVHNQINVLKSELDSATTAVDAEDKISLGNTDVSVPWGKKFKMLITSKQTGKKIEIRFKFDHKPE